MTVKKRLFWSNILMIAVPVVTALAAGVCCIALLWLMLQNGSGLPLEDSGDFSWASRAVVKLVSRSLEEGKSLDALGETLQANGLRSPLTSIRAYVEGLLDGVARTDEAQRRYLTTIKTKAEDIERMVSQLFLFSKLDMAEYPMEPRTFRLDEVVTALTAETGEEYQSKGLEIAVESLCPVSVTADGALLRRVLTNIMDNSAKYKTSDLGRLWISVEDAGEDCRVVLTDDGPGVPEEALPKLFDAFYRSDPARKNPAGGSGLGLAIAARTVERMGGTIAAGHAAEAGLELTITLPKEDGHAKDSDC